MLDKWFSPPTFNQFHNDKKATNNILGNLGVIFLSGIDLIIYFQVISVFHRNSQKRKILQIFQTYKLELTGKCQTNKFTDDIKMVICITINLLWIRYDPRSGNPPQGKARYRTWYPTIYRHLWPIPDLVIIRSRSRSQQVTPSLGQWRLLYKLSKGGNRVLCQCLFQ